MIGGMTKAPSSPSEGSYRFPVEISSHSVWLYYRFSLSYRDVEELIAARGIVVTLRLFANSARNLVSTLPTNSVADMLKQVIHGTSTRCFLQSTVNCTISGGLLISKAMYWISWFRVDATRPPRKILPQAPQRVSVRPTCTDHR
jgi:hypothetical protein